jgi:hypothetical protein
MDVIYPLLITLGHQRTSLNFIRTQVNDCTYTKSNDGTRRKTRANIFPLRV